MKHALVVTSISPPNGILKALADGAQKTGWPFYLIGDAICPVGWTQQFEATGTRAYDISAQINTGLKSANALPLSNYSRKNLGYLLAMRDGAEVIVETDDDNRPLEEFWDARHILFRGGSSAEDFGWFNALQYFNSSKIWPRGFPLDAITKPGEWENVEDNTVTRCPIQQGLVAGDQDVDAIWRLTRRRDEDNCPELFALTVLDQTTLSVKVIFRAHDEFSPELVLLDSWCPFNSQNTTWFKEAFPLMYIPSFCKNAYRMDDIWRSFIAQRIAFENGWGILWGGVTVAQERNPHDLMKDFEQEIPGYLYNRKIVEMLKALKIRPGADVLTLFGNLLFCYFAMIDAGYIEEKELDILGAWCEDVCAFNNVSAHQIPKWPCGE